MFSSDLIASAIKAEWEELPEAPSRGICCVTAAECDTIARKHCIGPSFTDHGTLRAPGSLRIGVAAYQALKYKWERMSLWWCDGETFRRLNRQDARELIIGAGYASPAWSGFVTTSYKKHGCLRAPVNTGGRAVWLFDSVLVDCTDHARLSVWWETMRQAQRDGIGRQSMETLDIPVGILAQIDQCAWVKYRSWASDKIRAPLYQLLCYLLPSQEELKAEGIVWKPKYSIAKEAPAANDGPVQSDLFS